MRTETTNNGFWVCPICATGLVTIVRVVGNKKVTIRCINGHIWKKVAWCDCPSTNC